MLFSPSSKKSACARYAPITMLALLALGALIGGVMLLLAPSSASSVLHSWKMLGGVCLIITGVVGLPLAIGVAIRLYKPTAPHHHVEVKEEAPPPPPQNLGFTRDEVVDLARRSAVAELNQLPWSTVADSPEKIREFFPLSGIDVLTTSTVLEMLEMDVIKKILPSLEGRHLRLLGDLQYQSKDFPGAELTKDPKKVQEFLSETEDDLPRTRHMLCLLDETVFVALWGALTMTQVALRVMPEPKKENVPLATDTLEAYKKTQQKLQALEPAEIKSRAQELTGTHFRMLSNQQYRSKDFPAEEIIKDARKLERFLSIDPEEIDLTRVILKVLHPQALDAFKPHLPDILK